MTNDSNRSPFSAPQLAGPVREVLEGCLRGATGGVFPGALAAIEPEVLDGLDPVAVRPHLTEMLMGTTPDVALVFLHGTGVLGAVLPEVTEMVDFTDEYARHKDLWTHTVQVVTQVQPQPLLRWAALLHDIGKVRTRSIDERGKVHFFGHELVGARMFKRISQRLGFAERDSRRIKFLIRNHLRAGQYESDWTDSAVRRFGREMGDALEDLVALSRADITTKYERKRARHLAMLDELVGRVSGIREQDAIPQALPKGLGNLLMQRWGLEPGPGLGRVMKRLQGRVEAGQLPRNADLEIYSGWLEAHPEELEDSN